MRHGKSVVYGGKGQLHAHVKPVHQKVFGIGDDGADGNLAGAFVYGGIGKQQAAFVRIGRAVFQFDVRLHAVRCYALAAHNLPAQFQQVAGRLFDIDIEIVVFGNQSHLCVVGCNQCAFGNQRLPDNAGNGRGDVGMVHVYLCGADGGIGGFYLCCGRTLGGNGGIPLLLAEGIGGDQRTVARHIGIGFCQCRLCGGEAGARAFQIGGIGGIIQLVERLAGFHQSAFLKQAAFHDAAHLRDDGCGAHGFQTAGQICFHGDGGRLHGYYADRGGGHLPSAALLTRRSGSRFGKRVEPAFACGQGKRYGSRSRCNAPCEFCCHIVFLMIGHGCYRRVLRQPEKLFQAAYIWRM